MQVKNATKNGRFTFLAGAWRHSISVVTSHVHHCESTLLWNCAANSPETLPARIASETSKPPTTGAGMLKRESSLIRFTSASPPSRTGIASSTETQAEIIIRREPADPGADPARVRALLRFFFQYLQLK